MSALDWIILVAALAGMTLYGLWRARGIRSLQGFLLSERDMRWHTIALSVMATQASAVTFLSTPGQAYADGMRFVQFYLGLPIAMVVLSITAVPIYHRLKVYTAYQYLEGRFDLKTRTLAALLFLVQRGLACGITIFAPSLILSVLLGWNLHTTIALIGVLVVAYTASGGTRSVNHTQFVQFIVLIGALTVAFVMALRSLPPGVSFVDALHVAGKMGRLNAVNFAFDVNDRYNIWSGLIGGCFLMLSYFGADQSQVGRYLAGHTVTQSRLGLLFNGLVKVPMQFGILLLGALVFVFYQFVMPPLFFNPLAVRQVMAGPHAGEWRALQADYRAAFDDKRARAWDLIAATRAHDTASVDAARGRLQEAAARAGAVRARAVDVIKASDAQAQASDTNYVFLSFILGFMPAGIIGLALAAVFAASMSSSSAELNALASTTVVDIYKRLFSGDGAARHEVWVSKLTTVFWGAFAVAFAEFASRLGSLIEAVNILGSLFYGTILGIFLAAFYCRPVGGTAVFIAAVLAEAAVIACFHYTKISFLWYNLVGCVLVVGVSLLLSPLLPRRGAPAAA